jgi:hypothetical protein
MEAAAQLLEVLEVEPIMTRSSVQSLRLVAEKGLPAVGPSSVP